MKSFYSYFLILWLDRLKRLFRKEPYKYHSCVTLEMIELWKSQTSYPQTSAPEHLKETQESCKHLDNNEKPVLPSDVCEKQLQQHSELPENEDYADHFFGEPSMSETLGVDPVLYPTIFGGGILGEGL